MRKPQMLLCAVGACVMLSGTSRAQVACSPQVIATETGGAPRDVAIRGNRAYVAAEFGGLQVYSLANPSSPSLVGQFFSFGFAAGVAVDGDRLLLGDGGDGAAIFDVASNQPSLLDYQDTNGFAEGVALQDDLALVADNRNGLVIMEVVPGGFSGQQLATRATISTSSSTEDVALQADLAYVANDEAGIRIIDVSNPSNPSPFQSFPVPGRAFGIDVLGSVAYVAAGSAGVHLVDVSNPGAPSIIQTIQVPGDALDVAISCNGVLVVAASGAGVHFFDVRVPTAVIPAGDVATSFAQGVGIGLNGLVGVGDAIPGFRVIRTTSCLLSNNPDDCDGDGLLDEWETNGIDINDDGVIDLDLPAYGANPLVKDIFVEIDVMQGVTPPNRMMVLDRVEQAFKDAPVDRPNGIELHLIIDETNVPLQQLSASPLTQVAKPGIPDIGAEVEDIKVNFFGTVAERANPMAIEAKKRAFRYCLYADTHFDNFGLSKRSPGFGELLGNDFVMFRGHFPSPNNPAGNRGDDDFEAGLFMHELGHTLGLGHGGIDSTGVLNGLNYKPHYFSVMNYFWQAPMYFSDGTSTLAEWELDYSREAIAPLDESSLNRAAPLVPQNPEFKNIYWNPHPAGCQSCMTIAFAPVPATGGVSWDGMGLTGTTSVNINNLAYLLSGSNDPTLSTLESNNDWEAVVTNISFGLPDSGNFADGASIVVDETTTQLDEIDAIGMLVPDRFDDDDCPADLSSPANPGVSDGVLTGADFFEFLARFQAGDLSVDFAGPTDPTTPDGVLTGADFFRFLELFSLGC